MGRRRRPAARAADLRIGRRWRRRRRRSRRPGWPPGRPARAGWRPPRTRAASRPAAAARSRPRSSGGPCRPGPSGRPRRPVTRWNCQSGRVSSKGSLISWPANRRRSSSRPGPRPSGPVRPTTRRWWSRSKDGSVDHSGRPGPVVKGPGSTTRWRSRSTPATVLATVRRNRVGSGRPSRRATRPMVDDRLGSRPRFHRRFSVSESGWPICPLGRRAVDPILSARTPRRQRIRPLDPIDVALATRLGYRLRAGHR